MFINVERIAVVVFDEIYKILYIVFKQNYIHVEAYYFSLSIINLLISMMDIRF
jgi:hypothetical protein